jgi:hypothetical protein
VGFLITGYLSVVSVTWFLKVRDTKELCPMVSLMVKESIFGTMAHGMRGSSKTTNPTVGALNTRSIQVSGMKGMEGDADSNQDNRITAGELHQFVKENVLRQSADKQTPELQGNADRVLVTFK